MGNQATIDVVFSAPHKLSGLYKNVNNTPKFNTGYTKNIEPLISLAHEEWLIAFIFHGANLIQVKQEDALTTDKKNITTTSKQLIQVFSAFTAVTTEAKPTSKCYS